MEPLTPAIPREISALCARLSEITYENLTKILRYRQSGSSDAALRLDDAFQNDLNHWMGGGTCFSITWHLRTELLRLGYAPQLLMGHKRNQRNVHCALLLKENGTQWFFDPGYLIFDPLPIPPALPGRECKTRFVLRPNWVELARENDMLRLWTGSCGQAGKLRFEFPLTGVSPEEFLVHWKASFSFEMMTYPVLNRLDRERGIQYYYQKGNLVTRTENGSTIRRVEPDERVELLARVFRINPALIDDAFSTLGL